MPGLNKPILLFTALLLGSALTVCGQDILDRKITINASNQRLADVLKQISNQGGFYFSYNSHIVNRDSLVSLSVTNRSIRQILDQLFNRNIDYKQSNNYLILRKGAPTIKTGTRSEETAYIITGYVMNAETGERIQDASIYGKQRLR